MTNTKFRKRALLSSVAMLLVALVALGSATFAWFSTTPTADAQTLAIASTKTSSLNLSEDNTNWFTHLQFTGANINNTNVTPVTFDGTTFQTTTAQDYNGGVMGTNTLSGQMSEAALNAAVANTDLYIRYGDGPDGDTPSTHAITLNLSLTGSTDQLRFARVALVPQDATASQMASARTIIYGNVKDDYGKAPASYTTRPATKAAESTYTNSAITDTVATNIAVGTATTGSVYHYKLYVYYEGTDWDCIDSNAINNTSVSFSFTAAE
ncbi:hypothetical protein [uncultured Ruminococcus sp.]|uniref:hypothetical protein n=1 Tax=uncultured Ruminococcus sp. TaxID=165186 RepID=UPI00292CBC7C|nr:hypothetical protein [uncultured Ruminococcus sp.]